MKRYARSHPAASTARSASPSRRVISSKYSNPEIGRRNLETLIAATMEATLLHHHGDDSTMPEYHRIMEELSLDAIASYRQLVFETQASRYFFAATYTRNCRAQHRQPPSARKATNRIEDLRAIRGCSAGATAA